MKNETKKISALDYAIAAVADYTHAARALSGARQTN